MMKIGKSNGMRGRLGLMLLTGSVVLMILLGYYLYLQAELDRTRTRNLRLLATMSTHIEQDLAGYVSVVDSLYRDCTEKDRAARFLNKQTSLYPEPHSDRCVRPGGRCFTREQDMDGQVWLTLTIAADPKVTCPSPQSAVSARANLTDEVEYFLPNDEFGAAFELVVVATRSGKVIYQPRNAQLHVTDVRTLFGPKPKEKKKEDAAEGKPPKAPPVDTTSVTEPTDGLPQTSSLTEVEIGGRRYELFAQPVRLASIANEDIQDGNEWVILGFARPFMVFKQALRLSYPWLSGAIGLLALAFLALPWIRIRYLPAHERLRRRDVLLAGVTAFLGAALVFALPVEAAWLDRFGDTTEKQIRTFGDTVAREFGDELSRMTDFAIDASGKMRAPASGRQPLLKDASAYPFADLVFLSDSDGEQFDKWSAFQDVSPTINISTLRFFIRSQEDPPYRIGGRGIFLDGLLAPTTGTYKAVLGINVPDPRPPTASPAGGNPKKPESPDPINLFLVAQPRSVFRTLVPPGFAFAVVDSSTGEVIFHSDANRNRNENLFTETENDPAMRAAMMARSGILPLEYRGRRDLAYVTRIDKLEGSPLAVLAVGDRIYGESVAVEAGLVGLMIFGMYSVVLAGAVGLFWLVPRPVWILRILWPSIEGAWRYAAVVPVMIAGGGILLVWARSAASAPVAAGAVSTGLLDALIAILILSPGGDWRTATRRVAIGGGGMALWIGGMIFWGSGPTPLLLAISTVGLACLMVRIFAARSAWFGSCERLVGLYTACVLSIVFATAIAPLAVFLRVAFQHEATLHVKYGQQRMAESLSRRRREVYWLDTDRLSPTIRAKWDAVADERDQSTNQVTASQPGLYHRVFYDTTVREGAVAGNGAKPGHPSRLESALHLLLSNLHVPLNIPTSRTKAISRAEDRLEDSPGKASRWRSSENRIEYAVELPPAHPPAHTDPPEGAIGSPIVLSSAIERDVFRLGPLYWSMLAVVAVLWYMAVRSGARRIFLMDWPLPPMEAPLLLPPATSGNWIYLVPLFHPDPQPQGRDDLQWLDFAQLAGGSAEALLETGGGNPERTVGIRNFDWMPNNEACGALKLRVLETLVAQGRRVVLVTRIDPIFHFALQTGLSDAIRQRWRTVLAGFQTVVAPADPVPPRAALMKQFLAKVDASLPENARREIADCLAGECCDPRLCELANELLAGGLRSRQEALAGMECRAAGYYAYLWEMCSPEEQVLLYHVARYRFANPLSSQAARQLHRKGLITRDPCSWLMNRSFRRFVRAQDPPDPIPPSAEDENRGAIEQSVMIVLVAISVPLVLAFVISHGDGIQSYVGILTAAPGTNGSLAKILGGRKAGSAGAWVLLVLAFVNSHGDGIQSYVGILTAALGTIGSLAKILGGRKAGSAGA